MVVGREKFCPQKKFAAIILYKVFRSGKIFDSK
jgi:hypothetical protein